MISDKPTYDESVLIHILRLTKDTEIRAALLQVFLADEGPLSEPAGKIVREILHEKFEAQSTADRLRAQGINPETFLPRHPTESVGEAVQRPVDDDRADAARYRWMRDHANISAIEYLAHTTPEKWDEAVDHGIAESRRL